MSSSERANREPEETVTLSEFELNVSLPNDARLVGAVRALVVCAAQQVGGDEADAARFGRRVDDAVQSSLQSGVSGRLPVTVRHRAGVLEVIINGRILILDP